MIRIGVIGPSRRRNGTGPFLARFFHDEGAVVAAVCGSSAVSSSHAAADLTSALGVPVKAFATPEQMIETCALDAVVVSSPAEHHANHLNIACRARLHTFCEKPLIWNPGRAELPLALAGRVAQIQGSFLERGLVLHQNTQWTYVLNDLRVLLGEDLFDEVRSFEMAMAPPAPGLSMFWEAVPHPISMITVLGASRVLRSIRVDITEDLSALNITFEASRPAREPLHVCIRLKARAEQPRPCYMILNGTRIDREVVSMSPYELALRRDQCLYAIVDPVRRSVKEFLGRVHLRLPEDDSGIVKQFQLIDALWPEVSSAASARLACP